MEEVEQEKVLRPEIKSANIVYRELNGEAKGIHLRKKEADKLYTELSTGIIKGASVFETVAYFREDDEDHDSRVVKRPVFVNMMHVETVLFDIVEEEEDEE